HFRYLYYYTKERGNGGKCTDYRNRRFGSIAVLESRDMMCHNGHRFLGSVYNRTTPMSFRVIELSSTNIVASKSVHQYVRLQNVSARRNCCHHPMTRHYLSLPLSIT